MDDKLRCEDFDQNNDKGDLMLLRSQRFSPFGPRINGVSPSANLVAKLLAKKSRCPIKWGTGRALVKGPWKYLRDNAEVRGDLRL